MDHNDYERYHNRKAYCKEGESESHIAAGWAILACVIFVPAWLLFLWATGVIVL